jgi:hypothetical protein
LSLKSVGRFLVKDLKPFFQCSKRHLNCNSKVWVSQIENSFTFWGRFLELNSLMWYLVFPKRCGIPDRHAYPTCRR